MGTMTKEKLLVQNKMPSQKNEASPGVVVGIPAGEIMLVARKDMVRMIHLNHLMQSFCDNVGMLANGVVKVVNVITFIQRIHMPLARYFLSMVPVDPRSG